MFLLRWSSGKYLTAVAGNYGVERKPLGFSDDDFFRSVAQVLMADHKVIGRAFYQLLEIALGPSETLYFQTESAKAIGDTYLDFGPYGDYVEITGWNATPFTADERITITVANPGVTTITVSAFHVFHDATGSRLFFRDQFSTPPGLDYIDGAVITGELSGGSATIASIASHRIGSERMPIYGTAKVYLPDPADPLNPAAGTQLETVQFVSPDPYSGRVRLLEPLTVEHSTGSIIRIEGGCWEFIETRARRIAIKVDCDTLFDEGLPGNAYLHTVPQQDHKTTATLSAGATTIPIADTYLGPAPAFPANLILEADENTNANLQVVANAFNTATRTFTLTAALAALTHYPKGSSVRWFQSDQVIGGITQNALIGATTIIANVRHSDMLGHWILDEGGANEEVVFVTKTTYQKRQLTSNITPAKTIFAIDYPLDAIDEGTVSLVFKVTDNTGVLGYVTVSSVTWYEGSNENKIHPQLGLASPPGFSTNINARPTFVELVDNVSGEVTITLQDALAIAHSSGESLIRFSGTNPVAATYADHLPEAGWPQSSTPSGRWPGPYLWEPSLRAVINSQGTGIARVEVDRTSATDVRSYIGSALISAPYIATNPTLAPISPGILPSGSTPIYILRVDDGTSFPTDVQVASWMADVANNPSGLPPRITIQGEGGFGREPVYFWGRGVTGTNLENHLYVSGVRRNHAVGVRVSMFIEQLAINRLSGTWGGSPGLDLTGGTLLLDFGAADEERLVYTSLSVRTPDRAILNFTRGFVPTVSRDTYRVSDVDNSTVIGVQLVRSDALAIPGVDDDLEGFDFPAYLPGGALIRLRDLVDFVRSAGVQVSFYDQDDVLLAI